MRVIPPVTIDDHTPITNDAPEPWNPNEWLIGTTYGKGAIVKMDAKNKIYESLQGSNTGKSPDVSPLWWSKVGVVEDAWSSGLVYALGDTCSSSGANSYHRVYESLQDSNQGNALPVPPETINDWWQDVGPTNAYAMFDLSRNTQTVYSAASDAPTNTTLTVVVTPGQRGNSLALLGIEADSVSISAASPSNPSPTTRKYPLAWSSTTTYKKGDCCTASSGTSYKSLVDANLNHTPPNASYWSVVNGAYFDLSARQVFDAYDYAFLPFDYRRSAVVFDIPPYSDVVITIKLTRITGNVKIGSFCFGNYGYLGSLAWGAEADSLNFSTIERDTFGNSILVPRRTVPKTAQTLYVDKARVDKIRDVRTLLNAVPAVWTAIDDSTDLYFDSLVILGVYKKFSINVDNVQQSIVSLELEEI